MRAVLFGLALILASTPSLAAGQKTFKDWTAVCNNLRTCIAFGFASEDDGGDESYLRIKRDGARTAAPEVSLTVLSDATPRPRTWSLQVDGKPVAGLEAVAISADADTEQATLTAAQGRALVAALKAGAKLDLIAGGVTAATLSLSGSAAALLWIDDQQQRVGSVSALAQPGPKPISAIPPVPPTPVLVAGPPASQAHLPTRIPAAIKALTKGDADCTETIDDEEATIARLAPGVILWGSVCDRAAYNVLNVFFVSDEKGRGVKPVSFPEPAGATPASDDAIENVDYDPKTRVLSSFSKGRGIGDCGSATSWLWDGKAFRLLSEDIMPECHGVNEDEWPNLYTATAR